MKQIYYIRMTKREQREDGSYPIDTTVLTYDSYCSQKKAKEEVDHLGEIFVKNAELRVFPTDIEEIQDIVKTEVSYSIIYKANGKTYEQEFICLPARLDEEED